MGHTVVEELAHVLEDALARAAGAGEEAARRLRLDDALDALDDAVTAAIDGVARSPDPAAAAVGTLLGTSRSATGRRPSESQTPVLPGRRSTAVVPVAVPVLDRLLDLAGELAALRARVTDCAARAGDADLARAAADFGRLSGALTEEVRAARLVSVSDLFAELPRVVRQAARDSGKQAVLETTGADVVADRAVLDALGEPLLHLLRNAVDHGIETPADRARAGKPTVGRIVVGAVRNGSVLVVTVEDDGRGVDRAAVLARARERGRLTHARIGAESDDDVLLRCLALPGLSTASGVGRVSGRGVGVDAALARVRALGGALSLRTEAGQGTAFELRMPLSWAVVPALVVRAGGAAYALPFAHVGGTREPARNESGTSLAALLGQRDTDVRTGCDVVLLVPGSGATPIPVLVDKIVGARDCVLKPLATPRGAFRIAAGATILDEGEVALVLDVPAVASRSTPRTPAATRPPP